MSSHKANMQSICRGFGWVLTRLKPLHPRHKLRLSGTHKTLLRAIAHGDVLKAHRDLEGVKVYKLHPLDGAEQEIEPAVVAYLCDHDLIDSNKKFPAATFWLTEKGSACLK